MKRTAIRELLKVTADPRIISFAGGLPAPDLFPLDDIEAAFDVVLRDHGARALQYSETEGIPELRDAIAARFTRPGSRVARENVAIVSGAQQALDLLGRILLDPGDSIAVENPTYMALLSAWRPQEIIFHPVPSDEQGIQVDQLEATLPAQTKLLYLTPTFQNPQGTTLSKARRLALVELARRFGFGLVEDDPYAELRFEGDPLPRLLDLDSDLDPIGQRAPGNVIHVGTFSKVLVPGLRVGWVIAAENVIEKLIQAKQAADLHSCGLSQHLILQLIHAGVLDRHIPKLCQTYRERRDVMLTALARHFPEEVRWTRPAGGLFRFVTLPMGIDATSLLAASLERQVAFVPGEEFYLRGQGRNTFRLNFSNASPERIAEGIRRLSEALETHRAQISR